jgi:hypothetical protein
MNRRSFLRGIGAGFALAAVAPIIVRAGSIMPVREVFWTAYPKVYSLKARPHQMIHFGAHMAVVGIAGADAEPATLLPQWPQMAGAQLFTAGNPIRRGDLLWMTEQEMVEHRIEPVVLPAIPRVGEIVRWSRIEDPTSWDA